MRKGLFLVAAAAMVCGAFASTAAANHSWNGYHWARTSNPFTLKVGDNVSSAWDGILNTTLSDWSRSTVLDLTKVAGQATGRCKGTTGRVEVCNGTYGNNGWLGVASISVSGGSKHITLGTVKVNDTYFNTSAYNTTAWRNLVSCQEVGHTLGLDHQDENFYNANLGTCMDYTANPGTNQHPNSHDYAELGTIYAHLDATTTVGLAAKRNAKPSSVKRSDRIVDSTIVWTFADGSKRITHVFWAIGSPRDHLPA